MPTSIHPDTTAPLSQWMIRKTFPTQNESEGARMESGRSDIPSPKNPWERCVSTDDPSVKGPVSAPWTPLRPAPLIVRLPEPDRHLPSANCAPPRYLLNRRSISSPSHNFALAHPFRHRRATVTVDNSLGPSLRSRNGGSHLAPGQPEQCVASDDPRLKEK